MIILTVRQVMMLLMEVMGMIPFMETKAMMKFGGAKATIFLMVR